MARKTISLALPGGGAHGAFGWGVLDALLADGRLDIRAISAASAGAMNAAALADGLLRDGADGARTRLAAYWTAIGEAGGAGSAVAQTLESLWDGLRFGWGPSSAMLTEAMARLVSPYDAGALSQNPLEDIVAREIDFEALRTRSKIKLFISATNVRTSALRVFEAHELTPEVLLASACLPAVFRAVEIDGEAYWDGGFLGNPALHPLLSPHLPRDVLIIHLTPLARPDLPMRADEIVDRMSEISFNASLLAELRALGAADQLRGPNVLARLFGGRAASLRLHEVSADDALGDVSARTKGRTEPRFLDALLERGRAAGQTWLASHFRDVGKRSSVDIKARYLP